MIRKWIGLLWLCALGCGSAMGEELWLPLFNGKDLGGWVQRGGKATYKVEDGELVGVTVLGTPNSFLCTTRDYADFILEYAFKVDGRLNSGVQIRSQSLSDRVNIEWDGKEKVVAAGRVHGYQVEIDPSNRCWSAGLFEEAARGWLYPGIRGGDAQAFTEQGNRLFKPNDWNLVRVEAVGDHIKTFLNGKLRADVRDARVRSGFIGLQVHRVGKKELEGREVRWRNLRIQDLGGHAVVPGDAAN